MMASIFSNKVFFDLPIPGLGRSPGEGMATPVFLPGESYGQRILASYSPGGCKEWDMTEQLTYKHILKLRYM